MFLGSLISSIMYKTFQSSLEVCMYKGVGINFLIVATKYLTEATLGQRIYLAWMGMHSGFLAATLPHSWVD